MFILLCSCTGHSFTGASFFAHEISKTEAPVRLVADAVPNDATFRFVDQKSSKIYSSPNDASPDAQLKPESPYTEWKHWNGVLNLAMNRLGDVHTIPAYTEFSTKNIAFSFDNYKYFQERYYNQEKWNYPFAQGFIIQELDDCGAKGASVFEVSRFESQGRYREDIEQAAHHMSKRQSRMNDGTFVRSFPRKWTPWADDLYMGIPFLARMGEFSKDHRSFDDATKQVINFHKYLFDDEADLTHHCWYSDVKRHGVAFWGRANPWAMLAQVDLLDRLPKNHPQRRTIIKLLQRHILGIARYQSGEGLWDQLLDKKDSYLETSCLRCSHTLSLAR